MTTAFNNIGDDVIKRELDIEREIKPPDIDENNIFEIFDISQCMKWITTRNYKRVSQI